MQWPRRPVTLTLADKSQVSLKDETSPLNRQELHNWLPARGVCVFSGLLLLANVV